jgi:hypothetical protein
MNAENPVQIALFGASATRTKDTRLAEHIDHLFVSKSWVWLMRCRSGLHLNGCPCAARRALLSRCGHYRLAGGRVEDALRAPLRGRAAPGP